MKQINTILVMICFPCSVLLFFILMACLWDYRLWVGLSLLMLLFLVAGVWMRGQLLEQDLRVSRFNHKTETPLSRENMPMVLRLDMRERQLGTPSYYQGYQQELKQ